VIAHDEPEALRRMREREQLSFPILVDPEAGTIRAYGIFNEARGGIAHPTTLIVDREGRIRHLHVDEDYRVRPDSDATVRALRELTAIQPETDGDSSAAIRSRTVAGSAALLLAR
jgi:peroxiredoxin